MNSWKRVFAGLITMAGSASLYQLIEHGVPIRREYTVEVPEGLAGLRILLISDLHCNPLICSNNTVMKQLKEEQPDVILLAGDMVSKYGKTSNLRVLPFLQQLSRIAPVIYGLGNHEAKLRERFPEQFTVYRKQVEQMGIYWLDNKEISIILQGKNVNFAGLTLPSEYYYKRRRRLIPESVWNKVCIKDPEQTILLAHFPDHFSQYASVASLVVSGHNHGGIIRLPKVGGFISPQLYLPPYTRGMYHEGNSTMVVSAGIGSHSLPARLFNRVEYCVIHTKTRKYT